MSETSRPPASRLNGQALREAARRYLDANPAYARACAEASTIPLAELLPRRMAERAADPASVSEFGRVLRAKMAERAAAQGERA